MSTQVYAKSADISPYDYAINHPMQMPMPMSLYGNPNNSDSDQVYSMFSVTRKYNDVSREVEMCLKFFDIENIREKLVEITNNDIFYKTDEIPINIFVDYIDDIKSKVDSGDYMLFELSYVLNENYKTIIDSINKMIRDGKVNFQGLKSVLKTGTQFVTEVNGKLVGSIVNSVTVNHSNDLQYLSVSGQFYIPRDGKIKLTSKTFYIYEYSGLRNIKDLSIRPATPEDIEYLTTRGIKFLKYASGIHYLNYNGTMFLNSSFGPYNMNASGRIIVDSKGFSVTSPNYHMDYRFNEVETILPEFSYMCWPNLLGFSFYAKKWGELDIEKISEITFKDNAFNSLVLNNDVKKIVKSLICNSDDTFTDIIDGKSGGCIFLLHGPPGVGKTLTCEAVAELLHKPLYSIGIGELGTTPEYLEAKLTRIIELAHTWNAIILIDECDIFMEARNTSDINRNAMVAIFLRLLERHQGVMFLTTNRINTMDDAFRSRISMIIDYDNVNINLDIKHKIWTNLLTASELIDKFTQEDINELSTYQLNGRQIKSAIRMSQSISKADNLVIDKEIIKSIIKYL